jgi:Uma2 family endonuclease
MSMDENRKIQHNHQSQYGASVRLTLSERPYSLEDFREIANLPENEEKRLEWEDGVIVDIGPSSRLNTVTGVRVAHYLNAHVLPNNLGFVTGADGGFFLKAAGQVRRPDVAFISGIHNVELIGVEFDIAPDLAVEIDSLDEDVFKKVKEYIRSGTRIVWVVYALEKVVDVFTAAQEGEFRVQELTVDDTLDGGEVLPGFMLPVRDIFPI